ncbi:glycosyltransferase family 2 protein [Pedobacter sp. SD-b]|uniref:Glycosyltransferase family 2 protein n=1 Tax=Pedobacter segetis TaxID=2793069 RepID=A0ABS1BLI4_9SPHI|nr:glycosyltransferase family 2 protein [Pedobacter segetis]MBK0383744.1 glycosyltransferase family 2 protein [Pedobacter segetis]
MIYFFYIIFFFLILRFTVTLFNFISNPKLTRSPKIYNDLVSVLIPARNEAENILPLLSSLKNQDYFNIEVIVLDDHSEDDTHQTVTQFCQTDQRFKIIRGKPLTQGWLGKNYACHQLAQEAKGSFLLFLDADEVVKDGLINNSLYRMQIGQLSLLSLFTNQTTETLGEKSVVPLMHYLLLNLLPLRLVKLTNLPSLSAASGQFMLFNAQDYHQNNWHQQVKAKVVEDIEIMKLVKLNKLKGEALLANGYIFCRMYKNYKESVEGFSKNLLSGFGNSIFGLLIYLFLVVLGPIFILVFLNFQLFYFAVTLIIFSRLMISYLSGQNVIMNIIFHAFQMISLVVIATLSIKKSLNKTLNWKGRTIHT